MSGPSAARKATILSTATRISLRRRRTWACPWARCTGAAPIPTPWATGPFGRPLPTSRWERPSRRTLRPSPASAVIGTTSQVKRPPTPWMRLGIRSTLWGLLVLHLEYLHPGPALRRVSGDPPGSGRQHRAICPVEQIPALGVFSGPPLGKRRLDGLGRQRLRRHHAPF